MGRILTSASAGALKTSALASLLKCSRWGGSAALVPSMQYVETTNMDGSLESDAAFVPLSPGANYNYASYDYTSGPPTYAPPVDPPALIMDSVEAFIPSEGEPPYIWVANQMGGQEGLFEGYPWFVGGSAKCRLTGPCAGTLCVYGLLLVWQDHEDGLLTQGPLWLPPNPDWDPSSPPAGFPLPASATYYDLAAGETLDFEPAGAPTIANSGTNSLTLMGYGSCFVFNKTPADCGITAAPTIDADPAQIDIDSKPIDS